MSLRAAVERFLLETRMSPRSLGIAALGDKNAIGRLRRGVTFGPARVAKLRAYMARVDREPAIELASQLRPTVLERTYAEVEPTEGCDDMLAFAKRAKRGSKALLAAIERAHPDRIAA